MIHGVEESEKRTEHEIVYASNDQMDRHPSARVVQIADRFVQIAVHCL